MPKKSFEKEFFPSKAEETSMHVYRTLRRDIHVCYGLEMNLYNLVEKFTTYIEGCKVAITLF